MPDNSNGYNGGGSKPDTKRQSAWDEPRNDGSAKRQSAWDETRNDGSAKRQSAWDEPRNDGSAKRQSAWDEPRSEGSAKRQSAWDEPKNDGGKGSGDGLRGAFTGKKLHTTLLVILLCLCMITNTVYAGVRAVFSKINIVPADTTVVETVTPTPQQLEEVSENLGEDEFDTSDLIISDKDVEIILLVGADFDVDNGASRSDTIMLIAVDRLHQKIKVISIMRDLYAPISGTKGSNKINFAYYYDSAMGHTDLRCTRDTIQNCFGVTVDHFAVVNFKMFIAFVNQIYPVEVEMNEDEAKYMDDNHRWHQKQNLGHREAGVYGLDGKESLYYVRMRKTGNGDYERTERQRRFLGTLLERAKQMSYAQMVKALTVVLPYITTDMTENQIFGYCFDAPRLLKYEMVQFRLPIDGAHKMGWATIGRTNVSILITDYTLLAKATQDFIYNDDLTYTYEGARATGAVLPLITTISFETTTEAETTATQPPDTTAAPPETSSTTSTATSATAATEPTSASSATAASNADGGTP